MTVTLETLKKSVGKKNNNSKIFAWLADLERAAGDLDTALKRVDGGLTLYSHDVAAMIVRAKILFQKEDFEGCVQQCDKILVKDPFSLAAQKIMGDAYDKLGNVAERNLCYRRYHDMDPLNNFWKEEYDVTPEAMGAAVGALAEDAFSMPSEDESLDLNLGGSDDLFEKSAEDAPAAEDNGLVLEEAKTASPFEKSNDSFNLSLDDVPEETASAAQAESSDSGIFGGLDLNEDDAFEEPASGFTSASVVEEAEDSAEDDPFAALAAMLPNSDAADDTAFEELSASLDSVMSSIDSGESSSDESFPVDDTVSGNDVNSALADMFGLDDDLEAEESSAAPAAPVVIDEEAEANASSIFGAPANEDKPMSVNSAFDSIFGEDELPEEIEPAVAVPAAEEPAVEESVAEESFVEETATEEVAEKPAVLDDEPTTVDNAFDSIFGEDELPEEKPVELAPAEPESAEAVFGNSGLFEKSADFGIFDKSAESCIFEKSADSDIFEKSAESDEVLDLDGLEEEPALEEPVIEEAASEVAAPSEEFSFGEPVADKLESFAAELATETSTSLEKSSEVESAFGSIFGDDDDLPVESESAPVEDSLAIESPVESLMEETAADVPVVDDLTLDVPADEPAAELAAEPAVEPAAFEAPAAEETSEVASAFGNIFGDDDDLPEEKPAASEWSVDAALAAENEELVIDESAAEENLVAEVDAPADPVIASPMDFVLDESSEASAEPVAEEPASESTVAVDSAFASIFGDDDDLPVEKAEDVVETPVDDRTLAEQVDDAEAELELPVTEEKSEGNDIAQEMGGAFASMFGNDDDLDLPDMKGSDANDQESTSAALEEVAATVSSGEAQSDLDKSFDSLFGNDDSLDVTQEDVPAAKPANPDLNSLETEVSGAFKGLFDMEDDSLTETMPSNKGVDFLMSGDSDDEVSASLINNPDAPLDRGAHELDESLNTRTLAEIYFDQGLYGKALDIYADLAQKEPDNAEIAARLDEIEKVYRSKFGGEG